MSPTATVSAPPRALPADLLAPVVSLPRRPARERSAPAWPAIGLALALAASPLASGYFYLSTWGPLALGAIVLAVVAAVLARPAVTGAGTVSAGGLGLLLALSAASMLWAESKDSAWTAANRAGLYCVVLAVVLLAVRDRRAGRAVVLILGSGALLASLWLWATFMLGGGQDAFVLRRLGAPVGYVNGTAGLLVMGLWPWVALSETATARGVRAAALGGAALIAGTLVLTQSRAVIPALAISALLVVLCAPERVRRVANLMTVGAALAATLPWTLAIYSEGPSDGRLRAAAVAIAAAALGAAAVRYALARIGPRFGVRSVGRLGAGMLAVALIGLAAGAALGGPWLAREYRSFTALHVNPNAPVRFTDAGGYRYDLWRVAVREFREHPLAGVGAGNYDVEYYRLRKNPEYVLAPHSLELQIAAELGVPGLLALGLFGGGILFAAFRRRGTLASRDRLIKVAAVGMFAAWLVATSVDWLYDIPGLTGMAIAAGALLLVGSGERRARRGSRPVVRVLGIGLVALLAASVARQYVANRYAHAAAVQVDRAPRAAIGTLRRAAQLDPYSLGTMYELAAVYARLDDYSDARATLELASRREPHNYVPPALLGDLAMRRGAYRPAVGDYRRALALNPSDTQLVRAELAAEGAAR